HPGGRPAGRQRRALQRGRLPRASARHDDRSQTEPRRRRSGVSQHPHQPARRGRRDPDRQARHGLRPLRAGGPRQLRIRQRSGTVHRAGDRRRPRRAGPRRLPARRRLGVLPHPPAARGAARPGRTAPAPPPLSTRPQEACMRILVAEDEPRISRFVSRGLKANGYTPTVVDDGITTLDYASSGEFDLLVLDVGLPRMDGFTVLRTLRELGSTIPVIIVTARDSVEDTVHGLEGGADDYLSKPFRFEELLARIRLRARAAAAN